jgi:HEPN domain-containing protein
MNEDRKVWLEKAREDLKTAQVLLDNARLEDCAFYCQQAVEKSLKFHWLKSEPEITRSHEVYSLARKLKLPQNLIEHCIELAPLYSASRYPDSALKPAETYSETDCKRFLAHAKEVVEWVEKNS